MSEATDIFTLEHCISEMQGELVGLRGAYLAYIQPSETLKPMIAMDIRHRVKSIGENIVIAAAMIQKLKEFGK